MTNLRVDGVAVYVFRKTSPFHVGGGGGHEGIEFLQLHRAEGDDAYPATWQPVYGRAEQGETAVEAARRELMEETGLNPVVFFQVEFIETFYFRAGDHVMLMPVFGAFVSEDAEPRLDAEHDAFRWVPERDVDACFMWRSQREAIRVLLEQLARGGEAHRLLQVGPT